MDDVVLIDTVPPPDVLDRIVSESRAVVVTVPPPARGAIVTTAVERGVPCVAATPLGIDATRAERLVRRARGALVPRVSNVPLAQLVATAANREKLPDAWRTQLVGSHDERTTEPDWSRWAALASNDDATASLGLTVEMGPAGSVRGTALQETPLTLPRLEEYAFEQGLKPALYLTLPRDEAAKAIARFASYAVATVDYDLEHDRVLDRRMRINRGDGEGTHRDVFVARERDTVEMARSAYLDPRGPSDQLVAMGAMLGYPACCVAAFESLDDRSNNTAIRYAAWKRTRDLGYRFDARLDNLAMHLQPWFPCTYSCTRSMGAAADLLASLRRTHLGICDELMRRLARPVLYFDHARSLAFEDATVERDTVRYRAVVSCASERGAVTERFAQSVGALFAAADTVHLGDPTRWVLERAGRIVATIDREARASGFLFPFERERGS